MAKAPIATNIHEPLDIQTDFTTQITFDAHLALDDLAKPPNLVIRQVTNTSVRIDLGLREQILTCLQSDTKDVRQTNFDPLVSWNVNSCNTCQDLSPL
jgi:hypothetical protein